MLLMEQLPASSSSPLLSELPVPLQELILSSLSLRTVLAISSSCKHFRSLISSFRFAHLHSLSPLNRSPWLFFFGFNFFLPHNNTNRAFAFDPLSNSWIRLPFKPPPLHINFSSLSAMNGVLFALAGAEQSQLNIAISPLKQNWHAIEAHMAVPRKNPLVAMFVEDDSRATELGDGNCIIVVAGGVDDDCDENDKLAVEIFRASKGHWEMCDSMPEVLKGQSLCSAVVGDMFYVADCETGVVCRMDVENGVWMDGKVQRPKEVKWWQVVGSNEGLWAVAICRRRTIKLYKMMVEAEIMEGGSKLEAGLEEVAIMPAKLYNEMFTEAEDEDEVEEEEEDDTAMELRCCGGGQNRLYLYRDSRFKENAICVCDTSNMSWFKMPPLPAPLHRFDKVACLSSAISLSSLT